MTERRADDDDGDDDDDDNDDNGDVDEEADDGNDRDYDCNDGRTFVFFVIIIFFTAITGIISSMSRNSTLQRLKARLRKPR